MVIMLINSGNDPGIDGNANDQSWPPLNIISLGSALEAAFLDRVDLPPGTSPLSKLDLGPFEVHSMV